MPTNGLPYDNEDSGVANLPPRQEPDEPPPVGLSCRRCGCRDLRVLYTRAKHDDKIVRRRQCRNCGARLTTTERVTG